MINIDRYNPHNKNMLGASIILRLLKSSETKNVRTTDLDKTWTQKKFQTHCPLTARELPSG